MRGQAAHGTRTVAPGPTPAQLARALAILYDVSRAFADAGADLPRALGVVSRALAEFTGDGCSVRQLSADRSAFLPGIFEHPDPGRAADLALLASGRIPADPKAFERILAGLPDEGRPDDLRSDGTPLEPLMRVLRDCGVRYLVGIPMRVRGEVVGYVGLARDVAEPYDAWTMRFLEDVADRGALAIENARLFAREHEARASAEASAARILALSDISRALVAPGMGLDETLSTIARSVAGKISDGCVVRLLDDAKEQFVQVEIAHIDPAKASTTRALIAAPRRADHEVFRPLLRGETVVLDFAHPSPRTPEILEVAQAVQALGIGHAVLVPFKGARGVEGYVGFIGGERAFDAADLAILQEIADRASLAIENARLLEREREARASLATTVEERTRDLRHALAELEAFTARVSHDLRGPLRAFSALTGALLEDHGASLPGEGRKTLEWLRDDAHRMQGLVHGLLALSRTTTAPLRRERVDISTMARQVASEITAQDPRRSVTWDIAPDLAVEADPVLMRLVLDNLLGNAWKYTRKNAKAHIQVRSETHDGETALVVQDDGVGFTPSAVGHLFVPFQRLHDPREFEGTGLGLATVKRIVERHGGWIEASAAPGEGATFRFTLAPRA